MRPLRPSSRLRHRGGRSRARTADALREFEQHHSVWAAHEHRVRPKRTARDTTRAVRQHSINFGKFYLGELTNGFQFLWRPTGTGEGLGALTSTRTPPSSASALTAHTRLSLLWTGAPIHAWVVVWNSANTGEPRRQWRRMMLMSTCQHTQERLPTLHPNVRSTIELIGLSDKPTLVLARAYPLDTAIGAAELLRAQGCTPRIMRPTSNVRAPRNQPFPISASTAWPRQGGDLTPRWKGHNRITTPSFQLFRCRSLLLV